MKIFDIIPEKAQITQGKDKAEVEYLQRAADFLSDYLNLDDHNILISLDPPMDLDNTQTGVTIAMGKNPNKIFIMIDKGISTGEKVRTLAHEMIHALQIASGRLVILELKDGKIRGQWEGETFNDLKYSRSNPWEVEAHTKDKELQRMVIDELGNFTR